MIDKKPGRYYSLLLLILFLLIPIACRGPILPSGTGSITLILSSATSRTISNNTDMQVTSFDLTGLGPESSTLTATGISGTSYSEEGITIGNWEFTVNGRNTAGDIVMTGSISTTITSGENYISIAISPIQGTANLDFSVIWNSGILSPANTIISSSLSPIEGEAIPLVFNITDGQGEALNSPASGYYIWDLSLEESQNLLYKANPEVVRLLAGELLTHEIDLTTDISISPEHGTSYPGLYPLLDWFEYPEAIRYDLQLAETEEGLEGTTPFIATLSEYQIQSELEEKTYYWRVRPVYDGETAGSWSTVWHFSLFNVVSEEGLVAEYTFDGGSTADSSGNENDGTAYGAVPCMDRFANPDGAYQLDGVDDRIEVPLLFSGDQDPVSFTGWVHLESDSGTALYAGYNSDSDTRNFFSVTLSNKTMAFDQFTPSLNAAISDSNSDMAADTWHFLAITKESDTVKFYLDGDFFSEKIHTETYTGAAPTIAALGARYGSGGWLSGYNIKGKIDDFRFYSRTLTESEIELLYFEDGWTEPPSWEKDDINNPVLPIGTSGSWDDMYVNPGAVVKVGSEYRMWFAGFDGSNWRIGFATSTNGIDWTKYSGNPVISLGDSGAWDDNGLYCPSVIKDGDTYKMWYDGHDGSNWKIGYAESSNGITWTKHTSNPVLNSGSGWEATHVNTPTVVKTDGTYEMWYTGGYGGNNQIGYASSADGIAWTKYSGNPVLTVGTGGSWNDQHVSLSTVVKDGAFYRMYYSGYDGATWRIGETFSLDGFNWTEQNILLNLGSSGAWDDTGVMHPVVLNDNGNLEFWYTGINGSNQQGGRAIIEE